MTPTLQDLEKRVQDARKKGAKGAEILTEEHRGVALVLKGRSNPDRTPTSGRTMTVRCWLDEGRRGDATGSPDAFDALVDQALAAAESAPTDPFGGPVRRMPAPPRGLGIDDPRHDQITDPDRLEVLTTNRRAAEGCTSRSKVGTFTYAESRTIRRFANHHGVAFEVPTTRYEASGALTLLSDEGAIELVDTIAGPAFASTACLPFGAALAQRVTQLDGDGPPLSGPMRVLLPPRATGRIMAWLATFFAADDLGGEDTFIARAAGEQLFHRRIHLVDDGAAPGGLHTRGFDDRGVTPVPLTLLQEGRVAARFLDPETARRLDTRPTGHVLGDGLAPTNLMLHAGARSVNAWMGEQDETIFEVDDLDTSGFDPKTGAVDVVVHGRVRHKHDILGARRFVRLKGDLVEALSRVHGVCSDTDRILHVDAPAMFVDGFTVEG